MGKRVWAGPLSHMRKTNRFAIFIGLSGILFLLVFTFVLVNTGVFNQGEITWHQYIKTSTGLSDTTFLTGKTLKTPPYRIAFDSHDVFGGQSYGNF